MRGTWHMLNVRPCARNLPRCRCIVAAAIGADRHHILRPHLINDGAEKAGDMLVAMIAPTSTHTSSLPLPPPPSLHAPSPLQAAGSGLGGDNGKSAFASLSPLSFHPPTLLFHHSLSPLSPPLADAGGGVGEGDSSNPHPPVQAAAWLPHSSAGGGGGGACFCLFIPFLLFPFLPTPQFHILAQFHMLAQVVGAEVVFVVHSSCPVLCFPPFQFYILAHVLGAEAHALAELAELAELQGFVQPLLRASTAANATAHTDADGLAAAERWRAASQRMTSRYVRPVREKSCVTPSAVKPEDSQRLSDVRECKEVSEYAVFMPPRAVVLELRPQGAQGSEYAVFHRLADARLKCRDNEMAMTPEDMEVRLKEMVLKVQLGEMAGGEGERVAALEAKLREQGDAIGEEAKGIGAQPLKGARDNVFAAIEVEEMKAQVDAARGEASEVRGEVGTLKAELAQMRASVERQAAEVAYVKATAAHSEARINHVELALAAIKKSRAEREAGSRGEHAGEETRAGKRRKGRKGETKGAWQMP
ncbi:unnamed protein product [Closterium sp. NIES-64]|nr:unnamed protein product [Closterium sp. NIES-64]